MTTIAITNPSDASAEAGIVEELPGIVTPRAILERFGAKLEDGAQVAMFGGYDGSDRVWQYIATRDYTDPESIALRANNSLAASTRDDGEKFIDYINGEPEAYEHVIEVADIDLETAEPEPELETFTVFGENDDGEDFVAVVSATEDTVRDVGIQAGLVDEGFEDDVDIALILKGDHSDLESQTI